MRRHLQATLLAATLAGIPSGVSALLGRSRPLDATREIGRFAFGRPSLIGGGLAHGGFSLLFSLPRPLLARAPRPVLAGALYGLALYLANFHGAAPRIWPEIRRYDDLAQVGDHVAFGVVLVAGERVVERLRPHR